MRSECRAGCSDRQQRAAVAYFAVGRTSGDGKPVVVVAQKNGREAVDLYRHWESDNVTRGHLVCQ